MDDRVIPVELESGAIVWHTVEEWARLWGLEECECGREECWHCVLWRIARYHVAQANRFVDRIHWSS